MQVRFDKAGNFCYNILTHYKYIFWTSERMVVINEMDDCA